VLLDKAKSVSKLWNDAPVVICGDFNCTPKVIFSIMVYHFIFVKCYHSLLTLTILILSQSPLYNFISEQKVCTLLLFSTYDFDIKNDIFILLQLDLSGIDRNKVSGQASAIRASKPYYGPNAG